MSLISAGFVGRTRQRGIWRTLKQAVGKLILEPISERLTAFRIRHVPSFVGPTKNDLLQIEEALRVLGVEVRCLAPEVAAFEDFKDAFIFPDAYHGGKAGGVYDEKRLEHFLAYSLCSLGEPQKKLTYVDVAAGSSPWVRMLRSFGYEAYAIDLAIKPGFGHLGYYLKMDATALAFADESIDALSLQCAFEMFAGDSDVRFLDECRRVLRPGGVVVISPLYMHTHHCGYASPEYWGKGFADKEGLEYVQRGVRGIPFSRKYSPHTLAARILKRIVENGMTYELYRLTNQACLGDNIYCHFVLAVRKPYAQS